MKVRELKELIEEAYIQILREADEPKPEDPVGDEKASEETVLEDATDTMLEKFPTLKMTLMKLMTKDFKEFVDTIDWVSPKPTTIEPDTADVLNPCSSAILAVKLNAL